MGAYVNGVYVPTVGESGWADELNDFLTRSGQEYVNVKAAPYGAVGDGSHDDTAAIQAAIDAAMGGTMSGTVPTPQREGYSGTGSVYIPAGIYKITAPIVVRGVRGLRIWGAGSRATILRVSGTITQAIQLLGANMLDLRGFSIDGVGGYAGTGHVTYGITWDWDPALTAGSSYRSTFHDIWVVDLDFKYGWGVGASSANYDVSQGEWTHCQVSGDFTPGDATTTKWQGGWLVGSGTPGNVLNHFFSDCSLMYLKRGYYIDNVNTVSTTRGQATQVEDYVYKVGPGIVLVRDIRIEDSWRIADTLGGASYTSNLSVHGLLWSQSLYSEATGRIIKWTYPGTVEISNTVLQYDGLLGLQQKIYCNVSPASGWISVVLRNMSAFMGSPYTPVKMIEVAGTTQVRLMAEGFTATSTTAAWLATTAKTVAGFNMNAELQAGSMETTGTTGTDINSVLRLAHPGDGSAGSAALIWNDGTSEKWYLYKVASSDILFLRDIANARMHATFTGGAAVTSSLTEFNGQVKAFGSLIAADAARATNATGGFLYIPTCAGTPTGVPVTQTGTVAMIYDTTNNKLYVYNGGWKGGTVPGTFS